MVSGSEDATIKIWNIVSYDWLASFPSHFHTVRCIIKGKDETIISGSDDSTIKIWNLHEKIVLTTLKGHKTMVVSLLLLFDGRLASCSCDLSIILWDFNTYKQVGILHWNRNIVFSLLQWSNDIIISGSFRDIIIWDISSMTCRLIKQIHNHNKNGIIKLNQHLMATYSSDYTIKLWKM